MRHPKRLAAVVFDFDGTLARPALDFPLMKRRIAALAGEYLERPPVPGATPALEWIEALAQGLGPDRGTSFKVRAHALIEDMEARAAAETSLFDFALPALERLRGRGALTAVITRNSRRSVLTVFPEAERRLGALLAREDVAAVKPDPAHLLAALAAVGATPEAALMVGDHPLDVLTARRAGTLAGAVASGDTPADELEVSGPDFLAPNAGQLLTRLEAEGWL